MSNLENLNEQVENLEPETIEGPSQSNLEENDTDAELDELICEFKEIVKKSPVQSVIGALLIGLLIGRIIR